ncbi:MAG TPA: hypothetical protein DCY88_32230 [Cyanobacteria bacterium UBA11372]|nr:hypothetical protein [Cyanobacteria bacterium UBA11372]
MKKSLSLILCLLTGAIYVGGSVKEAIATRISPIIAQTEPSVSPQVTPEPQMTPTSSKVTLMLEDLPPGFQVVPPQMTANFVEMLKKELGQVSLNPQNLFAFMSQTTSSSPSSPTTSSSQNAQIVVGYTGTLKETDREQFDDYIKKMQQPEVQEEMINQIRERLKTSAGIQIQEFNPIPELNNMGEISTGMSLKIAMAGQPMRIDIGSFRRNSYGALAAVMYPDGQPPKISLSEVARKLDGRISSVAPGVTSPVSR